ncbi:MAG TPA: hypothetical protein VMT85_10120 [Thermoanaerobaculia bacterium]|nr:hypothetical protein [Thermoanaerobaculia bacterium]
MTRPRAPLRPLASFPVFAAWAALLCLAPAEVFTQEPAATVERELAGIRATLQDIAALMRQQLDASNRDVLLRRIEIKNARLMPLEQELRSVRNHIEAQETELRRLQSRLQELEETAFYSEDEDEKRAARAEHAEIDKYAEQIREMITAAQARELETLRDIDRLEGEIASLEQRLDQPSR